MTWKLFTLTAAFCLFISGCDHANPVVENNKSDSDDIEVFRIGVIGFNEYYKTYTFSPLESDALSGNFIYSGILDFPFDNDLAENIVISENGRECAVKLRKDVVFHDGSKLTPEDVIYSLNEAKKNASAGNGPHITSSAISNMTVENMGEGKLLFKVNTPGMIKYNLVEFFVVSKRHEKTYNKNPASEYKPNGTGPMRFAGYDKSKGIITLERFDGYYTGIQKIKKVLIKSYTDPDAVEMAMLKDEIDYSFIYGSMGKYIKESANYVKFEFPNNYSVNIVFNTLSPKLKDWRVRKALSLLVDRDALVNDHFALGGADIPTSVAFSYSYPATKPVSSKPDPVRAMELFRSAGYKKINGKLIRDGKRLELMVTFNSRNLEYQERLMRLLGKMWEGAGINITLKDDEKYGLSGSTGDYEVTISPMADRFLLSDDEENINDKKRDGLSANFSDRELERLFRECRNESRESVLLKKKSRIQQRITDMSPIAPLFYPQLHYLLRGKLVKDERLAEAIRKDPLRLRYLHQYVK